MIESTFTRLREKIFIFIILDLHMTKASILQRKYSKRYSQTSEQDIIKPLNKRQALSSQQVGEKDEMVG